MILVQGAMGSAANYSELAAALACSFTVLMPNRRGRAMSPHCYQLRHSVDQDVEDVGAVRDASGARFVFGLSSGAMIALQSARRLPSIEKAALYEPPFYPRDIDRQGGSSIQSRGGPGRFRLGPGDGRTDRWTGAASASLASEASCAPAHGLLLRRDAKTPRRHLPAAGTTRADHALRLRRGRGHAKHDRVVVGPSQARSGPERNTQPALPSGCSG